MSDASTASSSHQLPVLDIPRPFEALSDVSNDSSHNGRDCDSQETASSERLSQPPPVFSSSAVLPTGSASSPARIIPAAPPQEASPSSSSKSRKKPKKNKEKGKNKDREKEKAKVKQKSREGCELSLGKVKASSVPDESTGESNSRAYSEMVRHYGKVSAQGQSRRSSSCVDGRCLVITQSGCCFRQPLCL